MSSVPETAAMHELDDQAIPPGQFDDDQHLAKDSSRSVEPSATKPQTDAARFSPDPLRQTDRYRLARPFNLHL